MPIDRTPWWKKKPGEREAPEPPPEPAIRFWIRLTVALAADLALAAAFLITWLRPYTFGEFAVKHFTFLMIFEFLVVHATGFLGAVGSRSSGTWERLFMYSVLCLVYGLFAAAFAFSAGSLWPAMGFILMFLGRAPGILFRPHSDDAMMGIMSNWAAMVCLYLFGVFFVLMNDVPALGITPEVIAAQEFGTGGEFPERPYIVMAFGALYFTGLALLTLVSELLGRRAALRRKR